MTKDGLVTWFWGGGGGGGGRGRDEHMVGQEAMPIIERKFSQNMQQLLKCTKVV